LRLKWIAGCRRRLLVAGIRGILYTERHIQQRSANDADQAEFTALRMGASAVEDGVLDDRIAGAMDDFDPELPDLERWQADDLRNEAAAGRLHEQIHRRQELLGQRYPFRLEGNSLVHAPSATKVYEFCLSICNAPSITTKPYVQLPRIFEQVARVLAQAYLGGSSHHTGWPRQDNAPVRFKAMMAPLEEATGEWIWQPEEGLPEDPEPSAAKDEGIDFVAWKALPDGRTGQLFVLAQCACGDDWSSKFHDTCPERLEKWFHPMTLVPPVKAFCTPHHVTDSVLREASRMAGIVFDRIRLTLLAESADPDAIAAVVPGGLEPLIQLALNA
jgi:hypothetical protein